MLRIAVNTRLLLNRNMEGIGRFTFELFSRIVKEHPEHQFYFIFDRKYDKQFIFGDNVIPVVVYPPVRHPLFAWIWFDITLKKKLKQLRPDVFFSPDAMNSLRPVCKTITVLHDINFESDPQNLPLLLRWYYRSRTPIIADRSQKIVTVSEFSKDDISRTYNISRNKIEVVYNAVTESFGPINSVEKLNTMHKYSEDKPYFVFIGGFYHRKNLLNLVKAYEIFKSQKETDIKLLLIGQLIRDADDVIAYRKKSRFKNDIIITGRIESDVTVGKILASALALTYISTIEGFGLPIVEAMRCAVPVITSNTSSMPEIAGDAALYVNPLRPEDVAEKMRMMAEDEHLRQTLSQNALAREKLFNWDVSAKKTWDIIESVAKIVHN